MKTKIVKVGEVEISSLIRKNFTKEFLRKVYDIYSNDYISIVDKTIMFDEIFTKEFGHRKDYRRIGEGTNRFVCLLDNHIIKVAYNYLAYIDNMNEVAQAKYKSEFLAQAYETNGIILVSEYVTVMDKMEFIENQLQIKDILIALEKEMFGIGHKDNKCFILGDMGMSEKNYGNWGRRMNGEIVVLDYGYLYELAEREWKKVAKCPKCGSSLEYTDDYSKLRCTAHDDARNRCTTEVNYTTIRNAYGYANIIKDIERGLRNDKYVKFDSKGKIKVDVMKEEVIEENDKIEFKMPEDIEERISLTKDTFYSIVKDIKDNGINFDEYNMIRDNLINNKDLFQEELYPFILASINMDPTNIDSHMKDFDKFADAVYKDIYRKLKDEFDIQNGNVDDEDDLPDIFDDEEGFTARGFEADLKRSNEAVEDGVKAAKSIADFIDLDFDLFNIINAEDPKLRDEANDELSFADMMDLFDKGYDALKESEKKEEDEEAEFYLAERTLKEKYMELEDALTELITSAYRATNCTLYDSELEYVTSDSYSTYINGELIDLDYSPRVNAKCILGGWQPNDFAFLLYRHLLIKYDYDTDVVNEEFNAIYRVDEDMQPPKDLYSRVENRDYVIMQIMNRFEDSMKPTRFSMIQNLGDYLNDYYKALDKYYDLYKPVVENVEIGDPDYYLKVSEGREHLAKDMREAKSELKDELLDNNIRLEDALNQYKVAYYYDIEPLLDILELRVLDIIRNADFSGITNVQEYIESEYYKEYNDIIPYSILDPFKYDSSFVKIEGSRIHPIIKRPKLKATLVPKNSNVDTFKPELFNNVKQTIVSVEQMYNVTFGDSERDETNLVEFESKLRERDLFYRKNIYRKYNIKRSNDVMRYGLTEKEVNIVEEYENMLRYHNIKDMNSVVRLTIVEMLQDKHGFSEETREFMIKLAKSNLSEAFADRVFKINVYELSNYMTRLDYLAHVD